MATETTDAWEYIKLRKFKLSCKSDKHGKYIETSSWKKSTMYLIHNRQNIIILASLRHDMHERHVKMNGIQLKLRKVWWPKLEKDMKKFVCDAGSPN